MPAFTDRLQHAWNAFMGRDPTVKYDIGSGDYRRPDRVPRRYSSERTTISSIYTRIAVDCAACSVRHVKVNDDDQYVDTIKSELNDRLTLMANKDQTGRDFIQDAVQSMLEEGTIAIVITDASISPDITQSYKIKSLRTAKILEWYPDYIKVNVYDEKEGTRKDILFPKKMAAIIQNPFYSVMNEPNSTAKRLTRKINLLDQVDEATASPNLDMIIKLPYVVKTESKRQQAEQRRKDLEFQLTSGNRYGIGYIDGTEQVIQLNRGIENNLASTVKDLKSELYSELSMTEEVMLGTANEETMLNYYNRTIEPIMSAVTDAIKCKFLSTTAVSQHQSIKFFRQPFKLVPVNQLADIADKFTRNEILTPNEMRAIVGFKPVEGQGADELRNRNINQSNEQAKIQNEGENSFENEEEEY